MSTRTVILTKPVTGHGQPLMELELNEPTAEDIMELGYPFLVHQGGSIELRPKVVGQYVVRLAKVPMSTVKQLAIPDLQACTAEVMGFFGEAAP